MITVTRTFATAEEAVAFLSGASPRAQATAVAAEAVETAKGKKAAEKTAPAPANAAQPAAASPAAPAASAAAASVGEAGIPYAVLQKAVFELAGLGEVGKGACGELVKQFEVATFKELKSEQYPAALAAVQARTGLVKKAIADAKANEALA